MFDTISSSSFWIAGDVHWACDCSWLWSLDFSQGKSLHLRCSSSRKFPLFISETSHISFRLSSRTLTAIFCCALKIKHSIITCKYCLLLASTIQLLQNRCIPSLHCYRNCAHCVIDVTWFSLWLCLVNFDGFFQFVYTNEVSFPNSVQAKHTHAFLPTS